MSPANSAPDETADESLKRLGGGRWQTRDERFTIEPQSGTWAVVDAEETDDLGLPLVRGPFRSLTDAKAAIATARTSEPPASPLKERVERGRPPESAAKAKAAASSAKTAGARRPAEDEAAPKLAKAAPAKVAPAKDEPPAEPSWFRDLDPADRGRARRLPDDASADDVAGLLGEGRDEALGVRWRIVDGDGRPIVIERTTKARRR